MRGMERQRETLPWYRFDPSFGHGGVRQDTLVAHAFEDCVAGTTRRLGVAVRSQPLRGAGQSDEQGRLGRRQTARLLAEISEARRPRPFEIAAERRQRQIEAEDLV